MIGIREAYIIMNWKILYTHYVFDVRSQYDTLRVYTQPHYNVLAHSVDCSTKYKLNVIEKKTYCYAHLTTCICRTLCFVSI